VEAALVMRETPLVTADVRWDPPFYTVRRNRFEATFILGVDETAETLESVDVEVRLTDDSRWSATVFTLAEVERLMTKDARSGENLGGSYFWCWDGLIVRDPGVESMTAVIDGLLDDDTFTSILRRLDDEPLDQA
jgi:hypothetical protein